MSWSVAATVAKLPSPLRAVTVAASKSSASTAASSTRLRRRLTRTAAASGVSAIASPRSALQIGQETHETGHTQSGERRLDAKSEGLPPTLSPIMSTRAGSCRRGLVLRAAMLVDPTAKPGERVHLDALVDLREPGLDGGYPGVSLRVAGRVWLCQAADLRVAERPRDVGEAAACLIGGRGVG